MTRRRPFRSPHHSASMPALVGGGLRVRPGEISLAHLGVLFLDELPEFQRTVLDSLRQPLETGNVSVARANTHVTFPARVQLVAAMNPCRCGHLGDPALACSRAPQMRGGLSGARIGASARPHRPACRRAGRLRRRSDLAAAGRRKRRGRGKRGGARARCRPTAITARASGPMPRRTVSCSTALRPQTIPGASSCRRGRGDAPVGARLPPGACVSHEPWLISPGPSRSAASMWRRRSATARQALERN